MQCPKCSSKRLKTYDVRHRDGGKWRRRRCDNCNHRVTTFESINGDVELNIRQMRNNVTQLLKSAVKLHNNLNPKCPIEIEK